MDELTAEAILSAEDAYRESVDVPDWHGRLHVKVMTGAERDSWEFECTQKRLGSGIDPRGVMVRLLVRTLCDGEGNLLFKPADAEKLNAKSSRAITQLFAVAQRVNGIRGEDVEELAGN